MKNCIISLTHDIDQALEDINTIKESIDPDNMFEGIPTSSLTMITKEELDRKKKKISLTGQEQLLSRINLRYQKSR